MTQFSLRFYSLTRVCPLCLKNPSNIRTLLDLTELWGVTEGAEIGVNSSDELDPVKIVRTPLKPVKKRLWQ